MKRADIRRKPDGAKRNFFRRRSSTAPKRVRLSGESRMEQSGASPDGPARQISPQTDRPSENRGQKDGFPLY